MADTIIRDSYGKIIGKIEMKSNGDKIVKDFYGRILGRYDKQCNVTRNFYGIIIAKGDVCGILFK